MLTTTKSFGSTKAKKHVVDCGCGVGAAGDSGVFGEFGSTGVSGVSGDFGALGVAGAADL